MVVAQAPDVGTVLPNLLEQRMGPGGYLDVYVPGGIALSL
jgi:hypothetical protein